MLDRVGTSTGERACHSTLESRLAEAKTAFDRRCFQQARASLGDFDAEVAAAASVQQVGNKGSSDIAIVVVSHKECAALCDALDELARQTATLPAHLIFVDNGNDRFFDEARARFENFTFVSAPFNVGCSAGRNLGVAQAGSTYVAFLEDDGVMQPGCLAALANCIRGRQACAVRGRVVPFQPGGQSAAHYDLGDQVVPSLINCEGVSIWERAAFVRGGGFDALLSGHEGLALMTRLWCGYGALGFLYEPDAVMRHDYSSTADLKAIKAAKHTANREYLRFLELPSAEVTEAQRRAARRWPEKYYAGAALEAVGHRPKSDCPISVVTVARDCAVHAERYTNCWKQQTHRGFEIVFVDAGSTDGTPERMQKLWKGDDRFRLIRHPLAGGPPLVAAIREARGDICIVAMPSDISVPRRIEITLERFAAAPDADYVEMLSFSEGEPFGARAELLAPDPRLWQMTHPGHLSALAFRRSAFDATCPAEEDTLECLHRRALRWRGDSALHPVVHVDRPERAGGLRWHSLRPLLGKLTKEDEAVIELLLASSDPALSHETLVRAEDLCARLLRANAQSGLFPSRDLQAVIEKALLDIKCRSPVLSYNPRGDRHYINGARLFEVGQYAQAAAAFLASAQVSDRAIEPLQAAAEALIAAGDYKAARRALRQALGRGRSRDLLARMGAASSWRLRRYLSRSAPLRI